MAFTYRVDVILPPTPDLGDKLVAHFTRLGFRLAEQAEGRWLFRRGHKLAFLYRFDIRAYSTTLRVQATPIPQGDVHVGCDYEIWTFLSIPTSNDVLRLEGEVAQFVSDCLPLLKDPRTIMSVSRLPGQFLPLWLMILLLVVGALVLGYALGVTVAILLR